MEGRGIEVPQKLRSPELKRNKSYTGMCSPQRKGRCPRAISCWLQALLCLLTPGVQPWTSPHPPALPLQRDSDLHLSQVYRDSTCKNSQFSIWEQQGLRNAAFPCPFPRRALMRDLKTGKESVSHASSPDLQPGLFLPHGRG